jgi:hypothetical protein
VVAHGPPELYYPDSATIASLYESKDAPYTISPIIYGTVVWMYWREKWRIATKRSPDAEEEKIRGKKLVEVFDSLITRSEHDKNITYGFVLHHRAFHLFTYPTFHTKLWRLSTRDTNGKELGLDVKGKDGQLLERKPYSPWDQERFEQFCEASTRTIEDSAECGAYLGLVLRRTGAGHNDWVIKSPLYMFIDRKLGEGASVHTTVAKTIGEDGYEIKRMLELFPSIGKMMTDRDKQVRSLSSMIVHYMKDESSIPSTMTGLSKIISSIPYKLGGSDVNDTNNIVSIISNPTFARRDAVVEIVTAMMDKTEKDIGPAVITE